MRSCLYKGWVRHRRLAPVEHAFRYRVFMPLLFLDELDDVFRGRWLWSTRRPAVAWFRRSDHLGDPQTPLDDTVRDLVEAHGSARPAGPIALLTNLRCFRNPSFWARPSFASSTALVLLCNSSLTDGFGSFAFSAS